VFYRPEISREWIVSPVARRVYLFAAISTLMMFGCFFAIVAAVAAAGGGSFIPPAVAFGLRVLLFISALGAAILWVAMFYYWFNFDVSGAWWKTLSLIALFLFGPIAAVGYYFAVYRRRVPLIVNTGY
jgi:hypothetical protein